MLLVLFYPSVFRWTACLRRRGNPTSRRLPETGRKHNNSGNQPCSVGVRRRCSFGEPHPTICHCGDANITRKLCGSWLPTSVFTHQKVHTGIVLFWFEPTRLAQSVDGRVWTYNWSADPICLLNYIDINYVERKESSRLPAAHLFSFYDHTEILLFLKSVVLVFRPRPRQTDVAVHRPLYFFILFAFSFLHIYYIITFTILQILSGWSVGIWTQNGRVKIFCVAITPRPNIGTPPRSRTLCNGL